MVKNEAFTMAKAVSTRNFYLGWGVEADRAKNSHITKSTETFLPGGQPWEDLL